MEEHKTSSVQLTLSLELSQDILKFASGIKEDLLDIKGIEYEPHITVQYGFDSSKVSADDIAKVVDDFGEINFTLGTLNSFHNETDVLYIEVISDDLHDLQAYLIESFRDSITTDFDEYIPHITIAYMKPTMASMYKFRQDFYGMTGSSEVIEYSMANDDRYEIHTYGGFDALKEDIEGAVTDGTDQFETEESSQCSRCPKHDWVSLGSVKPYEHSRHQKHIGIKSKEICQICGSLRWKNLNTGRKAAQVDD